MYDKWLTTVSKVLGALGLFWIIPMALAHEFERGQYHPLIDGVRDDTDDPVFQYIVVSLALAAGAQQSLPEPTNALLDLNNCRKNYHYVIQSVAGAVRERHSTAIWNDWRDSHGNTYGGEHSPHARGLSATWKDRQAVQTFMLNPGPSHMNAARRILQYLAGSADLGITY
eukprot:1390452-Rhodomonas_salina.1